MKDGLELFCTGKGLEEEQVDATVHSKVMLLVTFSSVPTFFVYFQWAEVLDQKGSNIFMHIPERKL